MDFNEFQHKYTLIILSFCTNKITCTKLKTSVISRTSKAMNPILVGLIAFFVYEL